MNGFYQFTTKIKDTLKLDPFVNTVTYGDIFQVDLSKQTIFPLSHLVVNNVTKESNIMRFNISILAMDIVDMTKDETTDIFVGNDNTQDIWHTQFKVLDRLTELLRRGSIVSEGYQLDGNPIFEQFTERFENYLAGWTVTFDVLVGNDMTICEVGSSGGTCSPAGYLIKDSAGTTLYNGTIASGEVGTVTVGDSTVSNSDASYSSDVVAEGSLTLPDITINVKNSLATTVNTGAYPSVTDVDITAPDATININKTGGGLISTQSAPSGATANYSVADNAITVNGANDFTIDATAPLDIVLSDGTSTVTPTSVTPNAGLNKVDIVLPASASPTYASARLMKSGVTTSYADYDAGYYQRGRATSFYKLLANNPFGHIWRFTGTSGGYYDSDTSQYKLANGTVSTFAGAFPNSVMIDWSTSNAIGVQIWALQPLSQTSLTWDNARITCNGLTVGSLSVWYLCETVEADSLRNWQLAGHHSWLPLNFEISFWSANTNPSSTTVAWYKSGIQWAGTGKANSFKYLPTRWTLLTELGL
jgi:hypothetical protein